MYSEFLKKTFDEFRDEVFIISHDEEYKYEWLLDKVNKYEDELSFLSNQVVAVKAEYSPETIAIFVALIGLGCIIVPNNKNISDTRQTEYCQLSCVEYMISVDGKKVDVDRIPVATAEHLLINKIRSMGHPGLILFSSGTTGKSKGVVHDFVPLLEKFKSRKKSIRSIPFLLFDHIGGINTLLYNLSNGGSFVVVQDRTPVNICKVVEQHRVELLPVSPTFINMVLLSGLYREYDLSSLKIISYGSEVMPQETLDRLSETLPNTRLIQMYGLSEIGILPSRSESSGSLWMKMGGEGVETRVVDGLLEIKSPSPMLGYINAPSPFTEDGWLKTGDMVEIKGDYIKVLGRESDLINIGGEKVFPIEIENIILSMPNVQEVSITSEKNAITGQIIVAHVKLIEAEDKVKFFVRMRMFCKDKLEAFKIPQKIKIVEGNSLHTDRYKKKRAELTL